MRNVSCACSGYEEVEDHKHQYQLEEKHISFGYLLTFMNSYTNINYIQSSCCIKISLRFYKRCKSSYIMIKDHN